MATPPLNPLVQKIRAKYPGEYDDMDDATLTKKVLAKYPEYSDLAAPPLSAAPGPKPSIITNAPEQSGLETGPLHSPNASENKGLFDFSGAPSFNRSESARFIARAIHSAGQAMNPVTQVPAMLHAFVDKPESVQQASEEAGAEAGGGGPLGMPPLLSRFLYRTAVKPAMAAVEDYSAGRMTPENILNNAAEGLGAGAGTVVGGKILDTLPGIPKALRNAMKSEVPENLVSNTYSPTGDHISSALRSNTKVDVPAEAKIAAPAIEEGLNDRGITTKSFKGRNGPTALQAGIDNALIFTRPARKR